MLHEPVSDSGPDPAFAYKRRLGVWMVLVYSVVYSGFVVINLVRPRLMGVIIIAGTNLAVVYGFTLILFAVALSLVYAALCSRREQELQEPEGND